MANQKYKIELGAVDKTKQAFDKLTRRLNTVKNTAMGVTKVVGGITVAFTGLAFAMTAVARKSFEYVDAIGKVSLRTGLSVQTIQALEQASIESGASIEETRKGFEKFARSVGDASRGLKTQADIFRDLGVEIRDNQGNVKDLETIIRDTAQGISQLGSESEKATALANLFGRAGIKLSEVFRDGSSGLEGFIEKAEKLGITLDQKAVDNVQAFNDSFSILSAQVRTLRDKVFAQFTPVLNEVIVGFSNMMTASDDAEDGVDILAQRISKDLLNAFADFVEGLGHIENALSGAKNFFDFLYTAPLLMGTSAEAIVNGINAIVNSVNIMGEETENSTNSFTDLAEKIRNTSDLLGKDIVPSITLTGGAMKGVGEGAEEAGEGFKTLTDQLSPLAKLKAEFKDEAFDNAIENIWVKGFNDASDALVKFVETGKLNFKDLVKSIIRDMIKLRIRQQMMGFFETFNILGLGSATETPAPKTPAGNFKPMRAEGGGFTGLGARTGGLDGRGGFPAILHPNETVIDHHKGQQVGQQPLSVNFSIQATDASGFDELLTSRKNQIVAMISQAMNQKGKVGLI
jgi:methyl-accepting chemotaxis protein